MKRRILIDIFLRCWHRFHCRIFPGFTGPDSPTVRGLRERDGPAAPPDPVLEQAQGCHYPEYSLLLPTGVFPDKPGFDSPEQSAREISLKFFKNYSSDP
jgi:hypothetical protein